jgi:hypothetical protein
MMVHNTYRIGHYAIVVVEKNVKEDPETQDDIGKRPDADPSDEGEYIYQVYICHGQDEAWRQRHIFMIA